MLGEGKSEANKQRRYVKRLVKTLWSGIAPQGNERKRARTSGSERERKRLGTVRPGGASGNAGTDR
jgi:hypothetical protein